MATKWACLGTGNIAWDFCHSVKDNLSAQDHELVALASRDASRAQSLADKFHFKRVYGSHDDVAKDEEVEVVYIATINALHVELSIKMLEAGKHVLCEKPMAMNQKEAIRVFEAAKKNKRLFMEGYWSHFFPTYAQIRRELDSGSLGDIQLIQANFCTQATFDPRTGAGGLMMLGGYPAMLACMVFKEKPESVKAMAMMTPEGDMDIGGCYLLKYKNGAIASAMYHIDTAVGDFSASIIGTKGKIQIQGPFYAPVKITTPTGTYEFPLKELKEDKYNYPASAGLQYEATAMRENIRNGKLEDEYSTMAMSEMIVSITDEVRRQIGLVYPGFD